MSKGSRDRTKDLARYRINYDAIDWSDTKCQTMPKAKKNVVGVNLSKHSSNSVESPKAADIIDADASLKKE